MDSVRLRSMRTFLPSGIPNLPKYLLKRGIERATQHPVGAARHQIAYDPKRYFESFYSASLEGGITDRDTISPTFSTRATMYHYNAVENGIILHFASDPGPDEPRVLDIGSGAGHWIDFYRAGFSARSVLGIDISSLAVQALQEKYRDVDSVTVMEDDISAVDFGLEQKFDIINAIGVMFHIVEDARWRRALENLAACLDDRGVMIVGGQFGLMTQNVQTHRTDDFRSWEELAGAPGVPIRVDKRLRSLAAWEKAAREAGLAVRRLIPTKQQRAVSTPQNNLLFLGHRFDAAGDAVPPEPPDPTIYARRAR